MSFDSTPLQVGKIVSVKTTYNKQPTTSIYVKEATNPSQGVYDALEKFNKTHPLEIPYQHPKVKASDSAVVTLIKSQMKLRDIIFTDAVLEEITFSKTPLTKSPIWWMNRDVVTVHEWRWF